jgi:hypothetical protein
MAEYYVVRDKNTGLYFRGKGVNRWGKYYNQASIYRIKANAENTIKEVSWRGEKAEVVPIKIFETADVVEVVRCKDCIHYEANGFVYDKSCGRCNNPQQEWAVECYDLWTETRPDDFCSYGERKEG